jgi:hypothetical protein
MKEDEHIVAVGAGVVRGWEGALVAARLWESTAGGHKGPYDPPCP